MNMNKLLKTTLWRVIGSFLLIPAIGLFVMTFVFRPWIIKTVLFGSITTAFVLTAILSILPMVVAIWYLVVGIRSLHRGNGHKNLMV